MTEIKRLAVFCGSNPGARPEYVEGARALGVVPEEIQVGPAVNRRLYGTGVPRPSSRSRRTTAT